MLANQDDGVFKMIILSLYKSKKYKLVWLMYAAWFFFIFTISKNVENLHFLTSYSELGIILEKNNIFLLYVA